MTGGDVPAPEIQAVEYEGDCERFDNSKVQRVFQNGEQFCYGDNITICNCAGLCRNK